MSDAIDPGEVRKAEKKTKHEQNKNTFENIAREWHSRFSERWSKSTAEKKLGIIDVYVFPYIGFEPVKKIKSPYVLRKTEIREIFKTSMVCNQLSHKKPEAFLFYRKGFMELAIIMSVRDKNT